MRTTVTLDDDVVALVREAARRTGASFKEILNDAVRARLRGGDQEQPYEVPARPLGLRAGVDLTHALRLAAEAEDEEIARKLELRK